MRFLVDPANVPLWILRHPRASYLTGKWLGRPRDPADRARARAIYREARQRRRRGENVVVDHVEPVSSDWVCGLGHAANLRIIPACENRRKSNGAAHPELPLPPAPVHQTRFPW